MLETCRGNPMSLMIAVAITWPVFVRQFRVVPEPLLPDEIVMTAVHASEHLVFRRPIRAGESIAVNGRLISMRPTAAGPYSVTHLDLVDSDGEIVATEYHGAIYRGVECPDGGREIVMQFPCQIRLLRDFKGLQRCPSAVGENCKNFRRFS